MAYGMLPSVFKTQRPAGVAAAALPSQQEVAASVRKGLAVVPTLAAGIGPAFSQAIVETYEDLSDVSEILEEPALQAMAKATGEAMEVVDSPVVKSLFYFTGTMLAFLTIGVSYLKLRDFLDARTEKKDQKDLKLELEEIEKERQEAIQKGLIMVKSKKGFGYVTPSMPDADEQEILKQEEEEAEKAL